MSQQKSSAPKCKTYTEQAKAIDRRIERAEANNTLDMILAAERVEIEACAVYDAIMVDAPDFITIALLRVLGAAAASKGLPIPDYTPDETKEEAIKKIADIFTISRDYKLADKYSPAELAQAISTVVNHPLTPASLYNALADELTNLESSLDRHSSEYLERALIAYTAECQQEGARG